MPAGPVNIGRGSARGRMGMGSSKGIAKNAARTKTVKTAAGTSTSVKTGGGKKSGSVTYTPVERTAKQKKASSDIGKRTKSAFKAKKREPVVATGAAMAGAIFGGGESKKPYGPPANKSVRAAARKIQAAKKKGK